MSAAPPAPFCGVPVEQFVRSMTRHWVDTLKNVVSPELQETWAQMAHVFNRQVEHYGQPEGDRWKVLQPSTGTGKSQGLAVYCACLSTVEPHPGVLIVVRLIEQATEIAETINRLCGQEVALAYHTDNKVKAELLPQFPVLVITHRAFEIGLDAVNKGRHGTSWNLFHTWGNTGRSLTVIDESLDIIEEAQIEVQKVKVARAIIPPDVASRFPEQMDALAFVENLLTKMAAVSRERQGTGEFERVLWKKQLEMPSDLDMTELRRALKSCRLDRTLALRSDAQVNAKLIEHYDTILRDVQSVLSNWNFYAKKLAQHTINTARLIVPDSITGAVILDATASSSLIYQLFDYKVDVIPVPAKARNYENVTLHVSMGHSVGKAKMVAEAEVRAKLLIQNLKVALSADRRVFVACHQWVEPHVLFYREEFAAFDAGHWNAIDGQNKWQDYDTAVIFGLPYRDRTWSANVYMALRGLQSTEWLQAEERPFRQYGDVRHALEVGQITVQVVEAINRVHCRRVIDEHGNCPLTDVFLLLPDNAVGRGILAGIEREMPGVQVKPWDYLTNGEVSVQKMNYEGALISYGSVMETGQKSASDIRRELEISSSQWERLVAMMKNTDSRLAVALAEHGVRYLVSASKKGRGRCRAHLVKS